MRRGWSVGKNLHGVSKETNMSLHRPLHHTDLSSASDWSIDEGNFPKFASANQKHYQMWVVTRHQYGVE